MNEMKLTVKGLFGHFDYEIPLYGISDADGIPLSDGVTILTGPNGYGKTTILRMLEAVSKGDMEFFQNLKFGEFTLSQNNYDDTLVISKIVNDLLIDHETLRHKSRFTFETLTERQHREEQRVRFTQRMKQTLPSVFMIKEQRLLTIMETDDFLLFEGDTDVKTQKIVETVTELPEKLNHHFVSVFNQYSVTDTKLNASFPSRVLNQSDNDRLTKEEFDWLYQDMNNKLRNLRENGLSDAVQQELPVFQADKAGILRIFFDDFNEKYKAYEPLINKLTLFRKILDRRFRTFKRVEISREYGLRVRDIDGDGNDGDVIPLEKLSSGEQETLVLYYQLIFETKPETILLIDEPEISLHIAWQRHFIDELKEIVRLNGLRAVVATHSASIIGRHRDIQVDLGALYQDELDKQRAQQG